MDAYVNHVPVLTGGMGRAQLHDFYSKHFIPKMPADTEDAAGMLFLFDSRRA